MRKKEIVTILQQQPMLVKDFPWYPTAYLAQYATHEPSNSLEKLSVFVNQPLRVHVLVSSEENIVAEAPTDIAIEAETQEPSSQPITDSTAINESIAATESQISSNVIESSDPEAEVHEETKPMVMPDLSTKETNADAHLFQPYYTVDYFASQGIKVDASLIGTTRFDTQLKSFTQWLKTMKRADYQTGQFSNDPAVDAQATASLEVKEVVTEAMAEVLAQQGRWGQAAEVYRKLTLLHPEKSAFFAAQIEKLKAAQ